MTDLMVVDLVALLVASMVAMSVLLMVEYWAAQRVEQLVALMADCSAANWAG